MINAGYQAEAGDVELEPENDICADRQFVTLPLTSEYLEVSPGRRLRIIKGRPVRPRFVWLRREFVPDSSIANATSLVQVPVDSPFKYEHRDVTADDVDGSTSRAADTPHYWFESIMIRHKVRPQRRTPGTVGERPQFKFGPQPSKQSMLKSSQSSQTSDDVDSVQDVAITEDVAVQPDPSVRLDSDLKSENRGKVNAAFVSDDQTHSMQTATIALPTVSVPLMFFVHDYQSSADVWREQLNFLASANGIEVVAVDLIGHGFSTQLDRDEPFTFDAVFIDLLASVDHYIYAGRPTIFIGHGLGCAHAAALAKARPVSAIGLVLVSSGSPLTLHKMPMLKGEPRTAIVKRQKIDSCCGHPFSPILRKDFCKRFKHTLKAILGRLIRRISRRWQCDPAVDAYKSESSVQSDAGDDSVSLSSTASVSRTLSDQTTVQLSEAAYDAESTFTALMAYNGRLGIPLSSLQTNVRHIAKLKSKKLKKGHRSQTLDMSGFYRKALAGVPTLLVQGLLDKDVTMVDMCEMERLLGPKAYLEVIDFGDHTPMCGQGAQIFNDMIARFVDAIFHS